MFPRAVKLMTLGGFDIKVDPTWVLIALLIAWSLFSQYFPTVFPGQTRVVYLGMAVFATVGFFASLILHEMAHSVVARQSGVRIEGITLFLFGGVAEMSDEPLSARAEFRIAIAGPLMSFSLALAFWLVSSGLPESGTIEPVTRVFGYLGAVNLILAIFNLVPAFPLDGGRILRAYLWHRDGDVLEATRLAARSGEIFAYVLMGLGLLTVFSGYLVGGLWQVLLGSFLLIAARSSYEHEVERTYFRGRTVADVMTRDPITVSPDMLIADMVDEIILPNRTSFLPVVDGKVLLGVVDASVTKTIDREHWSTTHVADVFIDVADLTLLDPNMPVSKLIEIVRNTRERKFLVTVAHRLVGVVTLADITRFLGIARLYDQRAAYP